MSDFEIFSIVLSFILGLGVANILMAVVRAVHLRRDVPLRLGPFLWAFGILLFHVNFLFSNYWFYEGNRAFFWYAFDLLSAVPIFLSGGLLLPSDVSASTEDLSDFFDRHGKLGLIPLSLFLGVSIPYNIEGGLPVFGQDNLLLAAMLLTAGAGYFGGWRIRVTRRPSSPHSRPTRSCLSGPGPVGRH